MNQIVSILWQAPLSVITLGCNRLALFFLRKLQVMRIKKMSRGGGDGDLRWRKYSDTLRLPMMLPFTMLTGPRWNCHVLAGGAGPFFRVRSLVEIRTATAFESAMHWTFVVHDLRQNTVAYLSSRLVPKDREWSALDLSPGTYFIICRYYRHNEEGRMPEIRIDNERTVAPLGIAGERESYRRFLESIRDRRGFPYFFLHYHMFHLIRWRKVAGESFVRKEFLPRGNPETNFHFDILRKGERLKVLCRPELFEKANVYVTYLNRCSFPVFWEDITEPEHRTPAVPCDGYYMIRVHSRDCDPAELQGLLECDVEK